MVNLQDFPRAQAELVHECRSISKTLRARKASWFMNASASPEGCAPAAWYHVAERKAFFPLLPEEQGGG